MTAVTITVLLFVSVEFNCSSCNFSSVKEQARLDEDCVSANALISNCAKYVGISMKCHLNISQDMNRVCGILLAIDCPYTISLLELQPDATLDRRSWSFSGRRV